MSKYYQGTSDTEFASGVTFLFKVRIDSFVFCSIEMD
jgi:hypothetical protein